MSTKVHTLLQTLRCLKEKKLVLFGTGMGSMIVNNYLPLPVAYYVDNDASRWESQFNSSIVKDPDVLLNEDKRLLFILVLSSHYSEIKEQLILMGFNENTHFCNGFELFTTILSPVLNQNEPIETDDIFLHSKYPSIQFNKDHFIDIDSTFEGENVLLKGASILKSNIGRYTYIGENTRIYFANIGRFCSIGQDCLVGVGQHPSRGYISTYPGFYSKDNTGCSKPFVKENSFNQEHLPIVIGNDVWIGARVIIQDGLTIGDGAIIGSGAVITKDVNPYSVVGGVPAKEIRKRYSDKQVSQLLRFRWWDKPDAWLRSHVDMFSNEGDFFDYINCIEDARD